MKTRISTIYGLYDPETDELRYIGKTVSKLNVRLSQHITASKKGKINHLHCWIRSLSKCPIIKPIEIVPYEQDSEAEIRIIAEYRTSGYNLVNESDGGEGQKGYHHSEETKNKLRVLNIGRKMPPKSEETLKRMSEAQMGKHLTDEHKESIRQGVLKPEVYEKVVAGGRLGALVATHPSPSKETREKMSASHLGIPLSDEHKAKISASGKGRKLTLEQCETRKINALNQWAKRRLVNQQLVS